MILFVDRTRRAGDYPWLEWKVRLFVIGAGLAVGGMVLERNWIVWLAGAFLAAGFLIRFLPGGKGVPQDDGEEGEGDGSTADDPRGP